MPPTLMVAEKPYTSLHWLQLKQTTSGKSNRAHPAVRFQKNNHKTSDKVRDAQYIIVREKTETA